MMLKKILMIISGTLILCVSGVWAGDTASFVDLGFSSDGKTYMFGQFGVLSPALKPWAELIIIDVPANDYVPNGRVSYTQDNPIRAGQDGSGIFYRLISGNSGLADRHGIGFQNQGQPLYISLDKNPPECGETIEFRDFAAGKKYTANLIFSTEGSGQNVRSSFYINLESHSDSPDGSGKYNNYTLGSSHIMRPRVVSYNIKKVLVDAYGDSIIFVIEMKCQALDGYDIRYMVEAHRL